uniref:Uncharacterized protein n=1 Tax=viral metagenome TaxID=1070528 RepID=A0A6M3KV33_9ZZZZ
MITLCITDEWDLWVALCVAKRKYKGLEGQTWQNCYDQISIEKLQQISTGTSEIRTQTKSLLDISLTTIHTATQLLKKNNETIY